MTVQLATGNTGMSVTSASDRRLYAGMFGTECYVHEIGKMCAASLDGPNKLVVQNGSLMINGAHVDLLGDTEFTIPSGLQAQKRATLCGVLYTATADGKESADAKTYTGEAVSDGEVPDPDYPNNNLLDGGVTETFMPLYRVVTDGINALDPVPMFKVVVPYAKFRDSQSQALKAGLSKGVTTTLSPGQEVSIKWTDPLPAGVTIIGTLRVTAGHSSCFVSDYGLAPNWYAVVKNTSSVSVNATPIIQYTYVAL